MRESWGIRRRERERRFAPLFMLANWTPPNWPWLETPEQKRAFYDWADKQGSLKLAPEENRAYHAWLEGRVPIETVAKQILGFMEAVFGWAKSPESQTMRWTPEQRKDFRGWLEGFRRAFDRAGFALPWGEDLRGRWQHLPGFGVGEKGLLWTLRAARGVLVEGGWVFTSQEVEVEPGRWKPAQSIGVLEALCRGDRVFRRDFIGWMQGRPVEARLSVDGRQVRLAPDPRNLLSCLTLLVAELIVGGWPVLRCPAPGCERYLAQWTRHRRRYCDDSCRTAYHNARVKVKRRPRGRPRAMGEEPASRGR